MFRNISARVQWLSNIKKGLGLRGPDFNEVINCKGRDREALKLTEVWRATVKSQVETSVGGMYKLRV